jgi:transposase InsO family protein
MGRRVSSPEFKLAAVKLVRERGVAIGLAAKADVFDYIERFYNTRRRRSEVGYLSPVKFENSSQNA